MTRSGSITVAGGVSATPENVTLKDNANPAASATVYEDNTFARENETLLNGDNTFVTVAEGMAGQATNVSVSHLPVSAAFYYDVRGNLTNDGRRVFFYDGENQLTAVVVSNAWLSRFQYDGLMRRRVRTEYTWLSGSGQWEATNEVRYIYDGRLVLQERHCDPRISATEPQHVVSYTRGNDLSGSFEGAGGIGGLLARTDHNVNSVLRHGLYHADGNGNITALLSTNGLVLAKYHYDPYGNVLAASGPLAGANLYRFSSKEYHPQSGLVYYLYRYYEPRLQRWVNTDPILEQGGLNLYGYVGNNPITFFDPLGLRTCIGRARVLLGNPRLIGRAGGFSGARPEDAINVTRESAAVDPAQWGGRQNLRNNLDNISGTFTDSRGNQVGRFSGVRDVIGGQPINGENVRDRLRRLNPEVLIIELPGGDRDLGTVDVRLEIPNSMQCPDGTHEPPAQTQPAQPRTNAPPQGGQPRTNR